MGGPACRAAGVELVADLRPSAAMGLTEVVARLPAIVSAFARLLAAARDAKPEAAVLVDYTEFNLRLGASLRRRGVPVLWCVAPQIWAWRPGRAPQVARALDRLAVILPFEVDLWRGHGVDAHYVGHPALDVVTLDRATARARLGLSIGATTVAVLPGSRPHEVHRHLLPMLGALEALGARIRDTARILVAASLDRPTRRWLDARARAAGIRTVDVDPDTGAGAWLSAFDAALAASGTATLECALAGAPPVVVYRLSRLSAAIARRLLRTPFVALPNVVLGRAVYPELLDRDVEPRCMARALATVLEQRGTFGASAQELRASLACSGPSSAERAANLVAPWLRSPMRSSGHADASGKAADATDLQHARSEPRVLASPP
jgi:lipid-A-disaccharide synthase